MEVVERIAAARVVAILRGRRDPVGTADALVAAGIDVVEITLDSPGALAAIAALRERHPDALIGAGTVRTPADARRAAAAGAQFTVAPGLDEATVAASPVPHVPGALTPTEIERAVRLGAPIVKLFPAGRLGPAYLRDVLAPLAGTRLLATGGIGLEDAAAYLAAGATAVGLGRCLVDGDVATAAARIRRSVDATR